MTRVVQVVKPSNAQCTVVGIKKEIVNSKIKKFFNKFFYNSHI